MSYTLRANRDGKKIGVNMYKAGLHAGAYVQDTGKSYLNYSGRAGYGNNVYGIDYTNSDIQGSNGSLAARVRLGRFNINADKSLDNSSYNVNARYSNNDWGTLTAMLSKNANGLRVNAKYHNNIATLAAQLDSNKYAKAVKGSLMYPMGSNGSVQIARTEVAPTSSYYAPYSKTEVGYKYASNGINAGVSTAKDSRGQGWDTKFNLGYRW